ncbi:MAG: HAMP domain-containing protein [FCB group bacterium]|nr:HAMP domain-containing protein [FCB group bacterium]
MTFTGRLRLALILAAILPMILITVIVVAAVKQQVKRIENREARSACLRFDELLENNLALIDKSIIEVLQSRDFELMELGFRSGRRSDPQYRLPLHTLDFLEYLDSAGTVLASANRPAMAGRPYPGIDNRIVLSNTLIMRHFWFERDRHGSHPSAAVIIATEFGFLNGGIYLDGSFVKLAEAVTRSQISFIDVRETNSSEANTSYEIGQPYRIGERLNAALLSGDHFRIKAYFPPGDQGTLFSDFLLAVGAVIVFSLLVVVPAGLYFSSQTRRKIAGLTEGAARVASGDFTRPVVESSGGEFGELAESFNYMMKELTQYREKLIVSQKIAAWQTIGRKVAHEVKNPLTPIAIAADDLKRSFDEKRPDFENILNNNTSTIRKEIDRLKKLINQFSTFARMPAPEIVSIEPASFAAEIEVLFKEEISAGRVTIKNNLTPKSLKIDPDQMLQVLINLIKNSLEAGSKNCMVAINHDNNGRLNLIIEDDGSGFAQKIIEDGITPYYSTKEKGSGLGLLISQRIVFDHDGTLILENKAEGGARVTVTVPQNDA